MRIVIIALAMSATSCALIDAFDSGDDGGTVLDAETAGCSALAYATPALRSTVAAQPRNVAVGDFDGDTHLDVAVGESTGVEFFYGDSSGSFTRTAFVAVGVSASLDLATARFDEVPDDLLVASDDVSQPSAQIFGRSDPAAMTLTASGLGRAVAVDVFDFDGQNLDDGVSVVSYGSYTSSWGFNDGSGTLGDGGAMSFDVLPSQVVVFVFFMGL